MTVNPDLAQAYRSISAKQAHHDNCWDYYNGDQPLLYTASRLKAVFDVAGVHFRENWCALVADVLLERIILKRFDVTDESAQTALNDFWTISGMQVDDTTAHLDTMITGEGYVMIWFNEDGALEGAANDPRHCHIQYHADRPRVPRYAAKWWTMPDNKRAFSLYYPDRFEHYISTKASENITGPADFRAAPDAIITNPTGRLPLIQLKRTDRGLISELANIIPIQDAINKLISDMMVAAEFGAFRQRWVITNSDIQALKNAPNQIWHLPAGDGVGQQTATGDFNPTDLGNYLDAIEKLSTAIGIISRTPRHYFYSQTSRLSGEALLTMEAPLVNKALHHIGRLTATWRRVAHHTLSLLGYQVDPQTITPVFAAPQTIQPHTQAQIRNLNVGAGIPIETELRREGWTDEQLRQLRTDRASTNHQEPTHGDDPQRFTDD